MKNFVKFGLTLVVFLTAFGVRANDGDVSLFVKKAEGKSVSVAYNDTNKVHFSIYSSSDVLLYEETVKGKINRTYDLSAFPEGTYYLEAETGAKVNRYEITISGTTAEISKKAVAEIYKPVVTNENGMVTVNILNADKSPIELKLYDDHNTELYSETITGKASLAKKFDIKKLANEDLTLVMKYDDKMFVETVAAK